ncbi:hypothetical protein CGRA01v4_09421 [Colletotrichum graminicola]|nr:hypothetical protein CGRA01v4_09421 [Colletotrichum graminicola]
MVNWYARRDGGLAAGWPRPDRPRLRSEGLSLVGWEHPVRVWFSLSEACWQLQSATGFYACCSISVRTEQVSFLITQSPRADGVCVLWAGEESNSCLRSVDS